MVGHIHEFSLDNDIDAYGIGLDSGERSEQARIDGLLYSR